MSSNEDQGGAGRREVAYRLFAAEFDDADFSYSESDEERAPNYVVTPTGARVNRVFLVGVLTEVETVSEDYLRARIVDPSGPFVVYAGQYQPEALAFLESAQPPTFVAVTGKARTYQPDDSDQVYTSVRPESISEVDAATRDRWVVATAEQTLDRVERMAAAKHADGTSDELEAALTESGVDDGLAAGIPIALEHYGTTGDYLSAVRSLALDAARVVADEQDEVEPLSTLPDQGTDDAVPSLVETPLDVATSETDDDDEADETEITSTADESADDQRAGTASASTERSTATAESTPSETGETASSAVEDDDDSVGSGTESAASDVESDGSATGETTTETDAGTEQVAETDGVAEPEPATETESETVTESESPTDSETTAESEPPTDSVAESTTTEETEAPTETSVGGTDDTDDDLGDFDPEFELDDDEREEIESEFGTDFQSGSEVGDPGEADIETPDPEDLEAVGEETADDVPATETDEPESDATEETDSASDDDEPAEDVDLEDAVMDAMGDLDDGDGADREAIIDAVVDRTGSDPDAVEDAIQDALMGGQCYEPDDGVLKPI